MPTEVVSILSADDVRRTITRLASQVIERARGNLDKLVLLGIHTRGVPIAQRLAQQIEQLEGLKLPQGALDITFHRDDLDQIGPRTPNLNDIPVDLSGKIVLLVDDVIYSGRTIRAALNAVNDYGRPETIWLSVLIDRGHRQLPIQPDFVGRALPTAREEAVHVLLQETDQRDGVELSTPSC
jgi:pyrimidine operon attenuation protein / uracil phosphoribosyltransferase